MGTSRCPSKGGTCRCKPKSLNFSFLLNITTPNKKLSLQFLLWWKTTYWKTIDFRQILSKILSVTHIFSYTIMTFSKKLARTKSLNTQQCPGLSSRIIPRVSHMLPKLSPLWCGFVAPARCGLPTFLRKPCGNGENLNKQLKL